MASSSSTSTSNSAFGPGLSLGGAIVTTGLLAGVYYGFSVAVMPGLKDVDDAAFAATMQRINEAIVNPAFMVAFLGAPALTAAAAWRQRDTNGRPATRRLLIAALALNLAGLGLTAGANIPLNDALAKAGDPATLSAAQLSEARTDYEQPWTRRHLLRTGVTVAAFGCLAAAGLTSRRRPAHTTDQRQTAATRRAEDASLPFNEEPATTRARVASAR